MKKVTDQELKELERYLDKIWQSLNIDVAFTRHFMERVNDERNRKQITVEELRDLFIKTYKKYGSMFSRMGEKDKNIGGVISDISTQLNSPFILKWDPKNKEFDLVSTTIMRKKNFVPNSREEKKYTVEQIELVEGSLGDLINRILKREEKPNAGEGETEKKARNDSLVKRIEVIADLYDDVVSKNADAWRSHQDPVSKEFRHKGLDQDLWERYSNVQKFKRALDNPKLTKDFREFLYRLPQYYKILKTIANDLGIQYSRHIVESNKYASVKQYLRQAKLRATQKEFPPIEELSGPFLNEDGREVYYHSATNTVYDIEEKAPCWNGYEMIGKKKKNGKEVPNCVPEEESEVSEISQSTKDSYYEKAAKDRDKQNSNIHRFSNIDRIKNIDNLRNATRKRNNRRKGMERANPSAEIAKLKQSIKRQEDYVYQKERSGGAYSEFVDAKRQLSSMKQKLKQLEGKN